MPVKKDFRKELQKLISNNEDSVLANYIDDCLKKYDHDEYMKKTENPYGLDLNKGPELKHNIPQPIPANIGNTTTSGWSNPFGGTSWGA
jgi:hypothetical protein